MKDSDVEGDIEEIEGLQEFHSVYVKQDACVGVKSPIQHREEPSMGRDFLDVEGSSKPVDLRHVDFEQ